MNLEFGILNLKGATVDRDQMRERTKQSALRVIRVVEALPKDKQGEVLGRQLLKSGTSIGANYRKAVRASSKRHFVTILQTSLREADETLYWLELLAESGAIPAHRLNDITDECKQLIAILAASVRTASDGEK